MIEVVVLLGSLLPLLVVGTVVLVAVVASRSGHRGAPVPGAAGPDHGGDVVLHARALRPGEGVSLTRQLDADSYGRLTITATHLAWEPDVGERWAASLAGVHVVGTTGAWSFGPPAVDVTIDGSGPWTLVVSDRPINRIVANDLKRFAEARTARSVAALLATRTAAVRARTEGPR